MKKIFYILLLILPLLGVQAQMNTAHWYFGLNAGVDFTSGAPVVATGGALSTSEGSSSISDEWGNLQFYTDGVTVYTQSHAVMPNGTDLAGKSSSSQSALIVPAPGPSELFYIFTTDAVEMSPKNGFRYTVVNMALGSEGEVLPGQKNILIPLNGQQAVSEKIAAVAKGDCSGYWIITYNKNKFYVFSLTEDGLDSDDPIVIDSAPFSTEGNNDSGIQGYIKVSPDGKKLAAAFKKDYTGSLILYDFDSNNGTITNGEVISAPDPINGRLYYGVEFSPNSDVLYATYSGLVRYDLTAPSIADSEVVMYNTGNGVSGALQIGLDGKIYYSRLNSQYYLGVINDPNNFDAPGFDIFGLFLGGQSHAIGLPSFPQPFYNAHLFINGSEDVQTFCAEDPIDFTYCFNGGVLPDWTVKYDFGDGTTSTEEAPVHSYADAGTYTVTLEITIGLNVITVTNTVIIVPLPIANEPADIVVCDVLPNDEISEFDLDSRKAAILGTQDPAGYSVTYHLTEEAAIANEDAQPVSFTNTANPQTIYVRVTNSTTDCYDTTAFDLIVNPVPVITDPDDLLACEEEQGEGIAEFDLTEAIPQIVGDNAALQVTFYRDMGDLTNNFPIVATSEYTNITPYNDSVVFKALDPAAPDCTATGELGLTVNPLYSLNDAIPDLVLCDDNDPGNGFEVFDLTAKYSDIINVPGLTLTYFYEQNGELLIIADPENFENTVAGGQVIFVSASTQFTCSNTTHFMIRVEQLPVVETPEPFYACEEEPGQGSFSLQDITAAIAVGQQNLAITYYASQQEAQDGEGETLPSPYLSADGIIYARVRSTITNCAIVIPVALQVLPAPIAPNVGPIEECDPDYDKTAEFNIVPALEAIEAALGNVTAIPFETYNDAFFNATNNVIDNPSSYWNNFATTTNGVQTIYIRVESDQTDCFDIVELQLIVNPAPLATEPAPYILCDNGSNDTDGQAIFDLTTLEAAILGNQDPALYDVTFYNEMGLIPTPASYLSASDTIIGRVTNTATGCYKEVDVELIVNPLPVANPPVPYTLCDENDPGDEQEEFDLTTKIDEIITVGGVPQTGIITTFYHSYDDAVAGINFIENPEAYTNSLAVETIFVKIEVETTGCYRIVLLDVRVEPLPVLVPPAAEDLTICDTTGLGIGSFDLDALVEDMVNGAPNLEVTFHLTALDAENGVNEIPNTGNFQISNPGNPGIQYVYVRVENTITGCTNAEPVALMLTVLNAPMAPEDLEDLEQCDDQDNNGQDGRAYFDLTVQDAEIHAALGTTPDNLIIHYFTSEDNANNGMPRITNPSHYYGTNGQTIWVRVETPDTECFSITSFQLELHQPLLLATPTLLVKCDDTDPVNDGQATFDLTEKDEEILGIYGVGQGNTVTYFVEDPRVVTTALPIDTPTAYTNPAPPQGNPKTLYVMVTTPEGCKSYTTLTIKVLPLPQPDMDVEPLIQCDVNNSPDGMEVFDLTDAEADIRNNDFNMVLTYYETEQDAIDRNNPIGNFTAYNSGNTTIWVRAEANTGNSQNPVCFTITHFELIVTPLPALGENGVIAPYAICEQNTDGIATFDFNTHLDEILGEGVNPADYTIRFFRDAAAQAAGTAMPYIYTNTSSPNQQFIKVEVTNNETGCVSVGDLALLVEEAAIANPVTETFFECDYDGDNDGVFTFDLTRADDDALGSQSPTDYSVAYYTSEADAQAGTNAIPNPTAYQNTTSPDYQMIWVRVTNESTISKCYDVTTLELFVERIPEPTLAGGTICVDFRTQEVLRDHTMNSGLDATHTFVWYHDGVVIPGATGPTYTAIEAGAYTVIATSATGCVSDPIADVIVERSGPASPIGQGYVVSNAFSDGQTIVVLAEGYGEYQYQLDNGPWQNSNVFENVSAGPHEVHIRDIATDNPCDEFNLMLENVSIIDYPNFFTPNGDGYNDTWNIVGMWGDDFAGTKIYIFDRYGKLLKQLSPAFDSDGWDGTFNGTPLPADDYWFTVTYKEGGVTKEFKAHFAMKR